MEEDGDLSAEATEGTSEGSPSDGVPRSKTSKHGDVCNEASSTCLHCIGGRFIALARRMGARGASARLQAG